MRELFLESDPIPVGLQVGDLIHGLRLAAPDAVSAMSSMRAIVTGAGASLDNVAQVSFFLKDRADMPLINPAWLATFPDDQDRPTYKFMTADLPGDARVHVEFWAVAGQRRRMLHIPNVAHTNPIPMGIRIGPYVFSSRVLPYDPATGKPADSVEAQVRCLFENVRALLSAGEAEPGDVVQGRGFVFELADAELVRRAWEDLSGGAQAPLHVSHYTLAPALRVMLEFVARVAR